MVDLAKGGVGFIITSHVYVSPEGEAGPGQLGIDRDELVDGLKSMCHAVHNAGEKLLSNWPMPEIPPLRRPVISPMQFPHSKRIPNPPDMN